MDRLEAICGLINKGKTFADIGSDHGKVAECAVKKGLCRKCYITDISGESLLKAERLLQPYIQSGEVTALVCDGFGDILADIDTAVIAGIGGRQIINILSGKKCRVDSIICQPMGNTPMLRSYLVSSGYFIEKDYIFKEGKRFYDIIKVKSGENRLTDWEIKYGRDNLKYRGEHFLSKIDRDIKNLEKYILALTKDFQKNVLQERLNELKAVKSGTYSGKCI